MATKKLGRILWQETYNLVVEADINYTNNHIITIDHNEGKVQEAARTQVKGASLRVRKSTKRKFTLVKPQALHMFLCEELLPQISIEERQNEPVTANAQKYGF